MSAKWAALGSAAALLLLVGRATADPYQVVGLAAGTADAGIDTLRATGTSVVFRRGGQDLWVSDGSAAGTALLRSGVTSNLTRHDGQVAFTTPSATPPLEELWLTDGTAAGTQRVTTIGGEGSCPAFGGPCTPAAPQLDSLTSVGSLLYFRQNVFGVWRSDGTDAGTFRIGFYAGRVCSTACFCCFYLGANLTQFTGVNQRLYFFQNNGFTGETSIERADGTTTGPLTTTLAVTEMAGAGGRLYIAVQNGPYALWLNDGISLRLLSTLGGGAQPASRLTASGGLLYFVVGAGTPGAALWRSNGTTAGTFAVLNGDADDLTAFDGALAFRKLSAGGDELWRSDGTAAGTVQLSPLAPSSLAAVDSTLFFAASDSAGAELWQSDGTPGGTMRVADLVPGPDGSAPADLTAACGRLYFTASTPADGRELWALDVSPGSCATTSESDCTSNAQCAAGLTCASGVCDAATGCSAVPFACCSAAQCNDSDPCTVDTCHQVAGCSHTLLPGLDAITCVLGASGSEAALCPGESIAARVGHKLDRVRSKIAKAAAQTSPTRALKRVASAIRALDRAQVRIDHELARGRMSAGCRDALTDLVTTTRARAVAYQP